jgi:hypothetical protein
MRGDLEAVYATEEPGKPVARSKWWSRLDEERCNLLANAETELTTARFNSCLVRMYPRNSVPITTPLPPGQITTTLNAFSRVIDDYDQMAKKETKLDKREKALL